MLGPPEEGSLNFGMLGLLLPESGERLLPLRLAASPPATPISAAPTAVAGPFALSMKLSL
jgi:hypothetical protein